MEELEHKEVVITLRLGYLPEADNDPRSWDWGAVLNLDSVDCAWLIEVSFPEEKT